MSDSSDPTRIDYVLVYQVPARDGVDNNYLPIRGDWMKAQAQAEHTAKSQGRTVRIYREVAVCEPTVVTTELKAGR